MFLIIIDKNIFQILLYNIYNIFFIIIMVIMNLNYGNRFFFFFLPWLQEVTADGYIKIKQLNNGMGYSY